MYCGLMLMVIQLPAQTAPGLTWNNAMIWREKLSAHPAKGIAGAEHGVHYRQCQYCLFAAGVHLWSGHVPVGCDTYPALLHLSRSRRISIKFIPSSHKRSTMEVQPKVRLRFNRRIPWWNNRRLKLNSISVKDRINQLFFGILLTEAQLNQIALLHDDLTNSS